MQKHKYTALQMPVYLANVMADGTVTNSLTATGSGQSDAYAIQDDVSVFTTVAAGTGGRLPISAQGDAFIIANYGANALTAYPPSTGAINNGPTNAGVNLATGTALRFTSINGTNYLTVAVIAGSAARNYEAGGPTLADGNFTWVNQGTATSANVINAMQLHAPSVGAVDSLRIRQMAAPATPFSFYMRSRVSCNNTASIGWGLVCRNSTSGRLLTYEFFYNNATGQWTQQLARWADPLTFNIAVGTPAAVENAEAWMRFDVTSTTVQPQISLDGWNWDVYGSGDTIATYLTATGGMLDNIGFFVGPRDTMSLYVQYFNTINPT